MDIFRVIKRRIKSRCEKEKELILSPLHMLKANVLKVRIKINQKQKMKNKNKNNRIKEKNNKKIKQKISRLYR